MTRAEKLSVFNAALTGLLANEVNGYAPDPKAIVRKAAEFVRTADTSTVVEDALY